MTRARLLVEAGHALAEQAAPAMTLEMLAERRGKSDVSRWIYAIKLQLPRQFFG